MTDIESLIGTQAEAHATLFDHNCTLCPLGANVKTTCVAGNGPLDAALMLVGQNPGQEEDAYGEPFIGPAGQLLDKLLARAGWDRRRVYVTNAAKCTTPSNRAPNARELRACSLYLGREIQAVRPKVIVALGAEAFKALTGQGGLTKALGSRAALREDLRVDGTDIPVIPTYHPAAVLHARGKGHAIEARIIEDLKVAVRSLDGSFEQIDVPWSWVDQPEQAHGLLRGIRAAADFGGLDGYVAAFDIETNGLPTWHPDFRIWMLAISTGQTAAVFRGDECIRAGIEFLDVCRQRGATLVGHNSSRYDREGILMRTGVNLVCEDTQLLAQRVNEDGPKNLQDLCTSRLGVAPWKDEVTWTWAEGPKDEAEWERAALYCARDTTYTRALYFNLQAELLDDPLSQRYHRELVLPASRALAALERNGLYLSTQNLKEAMGEMQLQRLTALSNCRALTGNHKFNPGSHGQVRKIVHKEWNLPAADWTDGNEESTNEYSLKWAKLFVNGSPERAQLIDNVLAYRGADKLLGTYLAAFSQKLALVSDGRLHPAYSLTNSPSRTASFNDDAYGFNAQNVPRDRRIRRIVAAPPGYKLISADLSMNELRVGAWLAPDPAMLEALRSGQDLHLMLAQQIAMHEGRDPASVTKKDRDDAKPVQFGSMYLATGHTLAVQLLKDFGIYLSEEQSDARIGAWHTQWPGFHTDYYPRIAHELFTTGMVRSPDGSVRHFPGALRSTDLKERSEYMRAAVNFPIQQFATTIALTALVGLVGYCADDDRKRVVQFGHDSYLIEARAEVTEQVLADIKPLVELGVPALLAAKLGVHFDVPIRLDVKVSDAWE